MINYKPNIMSGLWNLQAPFCEHLSWTTYKIYYPLLVEGVKPCRLLDIGCGTGCFLKMAYERGFDVYGVDFSEGMIKRAKSKFDLMNVENRIILSSIINFPFKNGTFDLVISSSVLSLIEDIDKAISEIIRVCKIGGEIRLLEIGKTKKDTTLAKMYKLVLSFLGNVTHDYAAYFSKYGYSCSVIEVSPIGLTKLFKITKDI